MGYGPTITIVDSSGNPIGTSTNPIQVQTVAGGGLQPVNVSQWNGAAPSAANPVLTDSTIGAYVRGGMGFIGTSGNLATATNPNLLVCAISLFNPAAANRAVLIYSILVAQNGSETGHEVFARTTVDPAGGAGFTGTPTVTNLNFTSPTASTSSLSSSATGITTAVVQAGTTMGVFAVASNTSTELIPKGSFIYLPAGTARGVAVYTQVGTAGNGFSGQMQWVEF